MLNYVFLFCLSADLLIIDNIYVVFSHVFTAFGYYKNTKHTKARLKRLFTHTHIK